MFVMMRLPTFLCLATCLQWVSASPTPRPEGAFRSSSAPVVDLGYSKYQGVSLVNGINQFLGMRFAAAPLGNLRFRAPRDPPINATLQDASQYPPVCLATFANTDSQQGIHPGVSEDCLFLNVFTPADATPDSKLPVLFWITGGGYTQESNANYNASSLIEASNHNVVYVEINYRLGPFGFLAGNEVPKNGDYNVGLLDQRKGLQWVQKYIHKFGGDPDHVVIQGDSAGAGSVGLHLTAYGGRNDNYFVGAISDSFFFPYQPPCSDFQFQYQDFVTAAGCSGAPDQLACLRNASTETLEAANVAFPYPGHSAPPEFDWAPCVDGSIIQQEPVFAFEQGKFIDVPILFGNDDDEGTDFAVNANNTQDIVTFFGDNYPKLNRAELDAIVQIYPKGPPAAQHAPYFTAASKAYGESTFICPSNLVVQSYARYGHASKTWNYRYAVLDPANVAQGLGTPHIFQTIGYWGPGGTPDFASTSYNGGVSAAVWPKVQKYWLSFIQFLDPNIARQAGTPVWPSVGGSGGSGWKRSGNSAPTSEDTSVSWPPGPSQQTRRLVFENNATFAEEIPTTQDLRCAFWAAIVRDTDM